MEKKVLNILALLWGLDMGSQSSSSSSLSYLEGTTKKKVLVICLNNYLAAQGKNTYATGGNIEYISLVTFNRKKPNPNTYVIYDEID